MPPKKTANAPKISKPAAARGRKPKAANGHQLAEPMPEGELLVDVCKRQWKLGKPVGSGGFGVLYLATPFVSSPVTSEAEYVVKIEPHDNGPLFCELGFYQRVAKPEMVNKWLDQKKMKNIGVPRYIASGNHEKSGIKYRFMVMDRFGQDLQKSFEAAGKRFSRKTVMILALRLLDILEYIHEREYVHADVKASNLLVGYRKGTTDQVFLVDYGLAFRYICDGKHKGYKEDPKRAHDGTIEFTSCDAHKGVCPSRRGDLEITGYCLLQWMCGRLPWEDKLQDKKYVGQQKESYMVDIPKLMRACFPKGGEPEELTKFMELVSKLDYEEKPNYEQARQIFRDALKKHRIVDDGKFDFMVSSGPTVKKPRKRKSDSPVNVKQSKEPKYSAAEVKPKLKPPMSKNSKSPSPRKPKSPSPKKPKSPPPKKVRSAAQSKRPKSAQEQTVISVTSPVAKKNKTSKRAVVSTPPFPSVETKRATKKRTAVSKKVLSTIATQTSPGLRTN